MTKEILRKRQERGHTSAERCGSERNRAHKIEWLHIWGKGTTRLRRCSSVLWVALTLDCGLILRHDFGSKVG
jgi:hypothetical protein